MNATVVFILKSIAVVILVFFSKDYMITMEHGVIVSVAGVVSTISGILFGFVLAAISILSSSSSSNGIIDALKKNNAFQLLVRGLLSTGITLITACLFTLISMFLPSNNIFFSDVIFLLIGLFYILISIVTFMLCWRKLSWIFPHM
ncbi:hypothetical protein [Proteus mirabilis]|mgnify:CR=1 FL=1|uniref:hypothetical protein n=1 Tax=Proteus mirabilis TaxID=584 RepID=UPI0018C4BF73|nr:hypothetical protein [Proteus mirabilis]MBG2993249.1 hypothetical protein [Proteus mirabilis]MBS3832837.1 hypothetical protein [Proteus mirabilis]MCT0075293.1 hypothetical protein [Proteus mirabilis]MDS0824351.1 hypothetical protein [Proteus mirabilis]